MIEGINEWINRNVNETVLDEIKEMSSLLNIWGREDDRAHRGIMSDILEGEIKKWKIKKFYTENEG